MKIWWGVPSKVQVMNRKNSSKACSTCWVRARKFDIRQPHAQRCPAIWPSAYVLCRELDLSQGWPCYNTKVAQKCCGVSAVGEWFRWCVVSAVGLLWSVAALYFRCGGSTYLYINESKGEILPIRKNVFASHVRCILRFWNVWRLLISSIFDKFDVVKRFWSVRLLTNFIFDKFDVAKWFCSVRPLINSMFDRFWLVRFRQFAVLRLLICSDGHFDCHLLIQILEVEKDTQSCRVPVQVGQQNLEMEKEI